MPIINNLVDSEIHKGDIPGTISGSMGRHFLMVGNTIFEGKGDGEPFAALNLTLAGIEAQHRALRKPGRDLPRPALAEMPAIGPGKTAAVSIDR